jgi:hypothetical protein
LAEKDLLCNLDKNRQAAQARGQPFEVLMIKPMNRSGEVT